MRDHFTPASDLTRASTQMAQDRLLILAVTIFAMICLGAAAVAMPGNIKAWEVAHEPV